VYSFDVAPTREKQDEPPKKGTTLPSWKERSAGGIHRLQEKEVGMKNLGGEGHSSKHKSGLEKGLLVSGASGWGPN